MSQANRDAEEPNAQAIAGAGEKTPIQFPLYKLFLVMAAYAVSFGEFGRGEDASIVVAACLGTSVSAWILAMKNRSDLLRSFIVAAGCFVGVVIGDFVVGPVSGGGGGREIRGLQDFLGVQICGAVCFGFLFAWTSRITRRKV